MCIRDRYYVLDCCVLAVSRQFNFSMWLHHLAAIGIFSSSLVTNTGHAGCMHALLAELLVPWGFLLFYFRAIRATQTSAFVVVCVGGMTTLCLRFAEWIVILIVHNSSSTSWNDMPLALCWLVNVSLVVGRCV